MPDYLEVNRANWDARADVHVGPGGYRLDAIEDPAWISQAVAFDRPLLGDLTGAHGVHLQCHIGTDTISLARLGAHMTGLDLSPRSLHHARTIAARARVAVDYVEADLYSAPEALDGRTFDLVYTGIGALCWLPDIGRWGTTVARLLRPGGRLFVRDAHPVLNALGAVRVGEQHEYWAEASDRLTPLGDWTPSLELPYWTPAEGTVWHDGVSYTGEGTVASPASVEWNHALSEIVMAVIDAGLALELLAEHDSLPWDALPGLMVADERGEYSLADRPERLPASFTLIASRAACNS